MGWPSDDNEDQREPTAQQHYNANLAYLRSHRDERNAIRLVRLEEEGPPLPEPADGARGWLRWYVRRVPTAEQFAGLLSGLEGEGLLTSDEVAGYAGNVTADSVAELTAHINAVDDLTAARQQMDRS
ncbi:hypothetical protein OG225_35925 [Nocardia sp. NBC_01377]|uniref:hypothetical protein n=1 Tax=Nocardia sp. NBC_01377 TaxID=2903595 RepID=UPI00325066A7